VTPELRGNALVLDLGAVHRSLSSAVLGGGLGWIRTWVNLQVEPDYHCQTPELDLRAAARGLAEPVVGMLTAAPVAQFTTGASGCARAFATVGLSHALAAAGTRPYPVPVVGTINVLVVVATPLSEAGLVNAVQTAVEAKVQALAAAGVPARNAEGNATGTATDSICIACPPGGREIYAGPATPHGADLARAVYEAVLAGSVSRSAPYPSDPAARPG
jgi:adenosylcobinamide amidohydrolase